MVLPSLPGPAQLLVLFVLAVAIGSIAIPMWRRRNMVFYLVAGNILVFVVLFVTAVADIWTLAWAMPAVGFSPHWVNVYPGLVYTLLTSLFVHNPTSFFHIGFNTIMLLLWGALLEGRLGSRRFGILFLFSGIAASVLYVSAITIIPGADSVLTLIGASGGVNGLLGGFARLWPTERIRLFFLPPLEMRTIWVGMLLLESVLGLLAELGVGVFFGRTNIAHFAHVAGLLVGFAVAPAIMRIRDEARESPQVEDVSGLEVLATTPRLRELYDKAAEEDEPAVAAAWRDELLEQATCPTCKAPVVADKAKRRVTCSAVAAHLNVRW